MGLLELFLIAVGLSMDAFAVAVCIGLSLATLKKSLIVGLYFGAFQGLMPVIGYAVGSQFADAITDFDHWIAFLLLSFIGGKMLAGIFKKQDEDEAALTGEASLAPAKMLTLALATSIDALAVGVSFSFLKVNIVHAASFIGITTLILSILGLKIGNVFGIKFKAKAEFAGGVILILIGLKILLEHTGLL